MSSSRDEELDEIERTLRMPEKQPEQRSVGDGAMCWRDQLRMCGPDCVAFNFARIGVPDGVPVQSHMQCVLIAIRIPRTQDDLARQQLEDEMRERQLRGPT